MQQIPKEKNMNDIEKKFRLDNNDTIFFCGVKLYRIIALRDFSDVKAGDKGGYVEKEDNLSHYYKTWVSDNAKVFGNAKIFDNAMVSGDAMVSGNAEIYGDAMISGNAKIFGDAQISDDNEHCGFDCFGSSNRHTHAYLTASEAVEIICGCFRGSIKEFEKAVEKRHAGTIYEKQYGKIIELIKIKFGIEE